MTDTTEYTEEIRTSQNTLDGLKSDIYKRLDADKPGMNNELNWVYSI
jgi:hypothetical protein